ncbi:TetR/AcrR family transcriptional regulator [Nocardia africana]
MIFVNNTQPSHRSDGPSAARRRGRRPASSESGPATRERVIQVAIELFSRQGFHGTGVAELAKAVGLGSGALYYHMGSKEELLWDVLRTHIEEALARAEAIADTDQDPAEKLKKLILEHVRTIAAHQREVAIYIRDADALTGERALQLQALRDRVQKVWQQTLTEGYQTGQFHTDDHVVVNGILGMMNMVFLWYRPGGHDTPETIARKFSETLIDGLAVHSGLLRADKPV